MEYTVRPLGEWLDPKTEPRRGSHVFKASWSDTLTLLGRELEYLDAERVVLQLDVAEGQIRRDGMMRADAKVHFPGVRISFESRYGPLTYATDMHERQFHWSKLDGWQANVRAIALGLEALRAVDRYGVTRRGEQYRGWSAIASRPAELTADQAAEFIAEWSGLAVAPQAIIRDSQVRTAAYRAAAKRTHPDLTGDPDTFKRLNVAKDLLDKGAS